MEQNTPCVVSQNPHICLLASSGFIFVSCCLFLFYRMFKLDTYALLCDNCWWLILRLLELLSVSICRNTQPFFLFRWVRGSAGVVVSMWCWLFGCLVFFMLFYFKIWWFGFMHFLFILSTIIVRLLDSILGNKICIDFLMYFMLVKAIWIHAVSVKWNSDVTKSVFVRKDKWIHEKYK